MEVKDNKAEKNVLKLPILECNQHYMKNITK